MNKNYQDTVVSKVSILYEKYKVNDEKLNQYKEKSSHLRSAIQEATDKLQQPNYINGSDMLTELEAARNIAINMDCEILRQKIEEVELNIKEGNTEISLNSLDMMSSWLSLLKIRLEYIISLETLNDLYQDQKSLMIKFKKIASILEDDIVLDDKKSNYYNDGETIGYGSMICEITSSEINASIH